MNSNFYDATNTAQSIVALSLSNPNSNWPVVCVGLGGERGYHGVGNTYRFADGSAVAFTASGLPVEYIGG